MKPPPFEYDDPGTVEEALALLAEHGDDAKVLAGGQSLVPLLNFRLARPERLIDVNNVGELDYLRVGDGALRIGALVRHSALERSDEVAAAVPLLRETVRFVGHVQIRNRGTVGGSIAHADPAAELPVAMAALDARFHVRSSRGERVVGADELFVTHLTTSLEPDELLTEIEVPLPEPGTGWAFVEFARRHGDFALGGVAALLRLDDRGHCERAAIALLSAAPTPVRAREAEGFLLGRPLDEQTGREAAALAVADIRPSGDIHGSSEYRHGLIEALTRRALSAAADRAKEAA
ncbi:MAG TPA: xanthine dehydrogenase family protein subunit M [Gaiellaceae bacterium]|nr:xanthine dehydrogenase family protein subunit M [Gaiellaceae bacterium]